MIQTTTVTMTEDRLLLFLFEYYPQSRIQQKKVDKTI